MTCDENQNQAQKNDCFYQKMMALCNGIIDKNALYRYNLHSSLSIIVSLIYALDKQA